MSGSGGCRSRITNDRFYTPPAMRPQNQEKQQQLQQQQSKLSRVKSKSSAGSEKRAESDDCSSSSTTATTTATATFSSPRVDHLTNLDQFLEHTTPIVSAQHFPKTSTRGWKIRNSDIPPYFILSDLWENFKEWSAYGAGVPLVLNGSDSVVQYYVPYLSGIQLYIDPSRTFTKLSSDRKPGEESDYESSRETSSDGSDEFGADRGASANGVHGGWNKNHANGTIHGLNRRSLRNDESEISNPPGLLTFEYLERAPPYSREPLADKISVLASKFPELKTYRSCDLTSSSWLSVAWYPIYRIPTGPTLQNLDACFLTFHYLSTPFRSTGVDSLHNTGMSPKVSLSAFGLATYKFKATVWNSDGAPECQRVNSLSRDADKWLRFLHVDHPDYGFFVSHSLGWR